MTIKKVAVISDGDSSSGKDAAWQLSLDGFDVAILSASGDGEAFAQELGGICITGARRSAASVQKLADLAVDRWGRIDVLINSAEWQLAVSPDDDGDRHLHAIMDTYLMNIVRPTRVVAPIMGDLEGGTIVNVVNLPVANATTLEPALDVFRAAMINFCNLVDHRFAGGNVKMANVVSESVVGRPEPDKCGGGMPIWRFNKTEEISPIVTCLVSEPSHIFSEKSSFDGSLTSPLSAVA